MKAVICLILFPIVANCAAIDQDALSAFQVSGIPGGLYAKIEHGIPLSLPDVVTLSQAGVSRAAIIAYLYSFGGHFDYTAADIPNLRRQGISADQIDYLTSPAAHLSRFAF